MTHQFTINDRTFLAVAVDRPGQYEVKLLGSPQMSGNNMQTLVRVEDRLNVIICDLGGTMDVGSLSVVALYPGMEESAAVGIVETRQWNDKNKLKIFYRNYIFDEKPFNSALESFASKMKSENLYRFNTLGTRPSPLLFSSKRSFDYACKDWQAAEDRTSKVWVIVEQVNK